MFAIPLHNLPKDLAVGVGYAGKEGMRANALTIGISIQNVPEGFVVAAALLAVGYRRGFSVLLGISSGLVDPLGAITDAMLFVISHEIIPESHSKGQKFFAATGLMVKIVLIMVLEAVLGWINGRFLFPHALCNSFWRSGNLRIDSCYTAIAEVLVAIANECYEAKSGYNIS